MRISEEFGKVAPGAKRIAVPLVLALFLAAIFYSTLLPGVGFNGDTAKFQFVGYILGTSHTTGYPTYTILNHLFTKLFPWGSIAYKANLLSAVFAIITCLFLYKLLLLLQINKSLSFFSSLTFGLTHTFWLQAVIAEVYTLNALFVSLVLYFFIKWNRTKERRFLLAGCAVYALSFGNHLTMITLLPAIIYFVWVTDRKAIVTPSVILYVALFILAGALQYSYIFWRSFDSRTAYLEMNATDLNRFAWVVTGGQFKGKMFPLELGELFHQRIPMYAGLFLREYSFLVPIGIYGWFRLKDRELNRFLTFGFLGNAFYAINYDIKDIYVYFIPGYLIFIIYVAFALSTFRFLGSRPFYKILLCCIPLVFVLKNFRSVDQSHNTVEAQHTVSILQEVNGRGVILAPGYRYCQYLWYFHLIERPPGESVYIVRSFSPRAVKNYLKGERALYIREIRKDVPFGLPVYYPSKKGLRILSDYGLRVQQVGGDLYRVVL